MGCCLEKEYSVDTSLKKNGKPEIKLLSNTDVKATVNEADTGERVTETQSLVALYNYESRNAGDLSFSKSDEFLLLSTEDADWWLAKHVTTGVKGYVPTNFVAFVGSLQSEEWFFGTITRKDSEKLLLKETEKGCFLIRESETSQNSYSLSILNHDSENRPYIKHYRIHHTENEKYFITEGAEFDDLRSLVKFYHDSAHGLCCQLVRSCSVREIPQTYSLAKYVFEIDDDQIEIVEESEEANDEKVSKALWNGKMTVTLKSYKTDKTPEDLETLKTLHHKCIAKFYGVVLSKPISFVWEYMSFGDLTRYISHKDSSTFSIEEKIDIASQVAAGMAYLESMNFAHKCLRTHSVFVETEQVFKIGDYGIYDNPVNLDADSVLWLAPDAIKSEIFDTKADVWSFGILVTIIASCNSEPYHESDVSRDDILENLATGYRMSRSEFCPEALYELLLQCWDKEPDLRPTFEYIQIFLESFFQRTNTESTRKK